MAKYQDINYGDFGAGIDQLSPENKIKDGYSQELINIDPTPEGSLAKRKGTQLYGTVPVRVNKIEYFRAYPSATVYSNAASYSEGDIVTHNDGYYVAPEGGIEAGGVDPDSEGSAWLDYEFKGELCFYLDPSVDVLALRSSPVFAYGRISDCQSGGDLNDYNQGQYYPSFTTDLRRVVNGAEQGAIILEGLAHGQGLYQAPLLSVSTEVTSLNNYQITPDSFKIDKVTEDLTAVIDSGTDVDTFLVTKSRNTSGGESYVYENTLAASELGVDGLPLVQSLTIPADTHGLDNFNILVECFIDDGTTLEKIIPHGYEIDASGNVEVFFRTYQPLNLAITLAAAPAANLDPLALQVPQNSPLTTNFTIQNIESAFPYVYLFVERSDGSREFVYHDTVDVDTVNERATVYLTKYEEIPSPGIKDSAFNTVLIWDYATLVSNKLCVEASDPVVENFNLSIENAEHGLGTPLMSASFRYSTNEANDNNYLIGCDDIKIYAKPDVELGIKANQAVFVAKNQLDSSFPAFGALAPRKTGTEDVQTFYFEIPENPTLTPQSVVIPEIAEEGWDDISNVNVEIYQVERNGEGEVLSYTLIPYFESLFNEATKDITLTGTNSAEMEILVILYKTAEDDILADQIIPAGETQNILVPNLTGNFPIPQVYEVFPVEEDGTVREDYFLWDEDEATTGGNGYQQDDVVFYNEAFYIASANIPTVNKAQTPDKETSWVKISDRARRHIFADRISVDSVSATMSVDITNNYAEGNSQLVPSPIVVSILYDYAEYNSAATCIPVTGNIEDGYVDENPQLTLYGLPHRQLYSASDNRAPGHVTHIDVYRAEAEERAICGLGGNIFASYENYEAPIEMELPTLYPDLRARVDASISGASTLVIGPAFAAPLEEGSRTAGVIKSSDTQAGTLKVVSATYISDNKVEYKIKTTQRTVTFQGINAPVYTNLSTYNIDDLVHDANFKVYRSRINANKEKALTDEDSWKFVGQVVTSNDYLTIENMGYSVHNGSFKVVDVATDDVINPDTLIVEEQFVSITVENQDGASSDFNQSYSSGRAGVFTDTLPLDGPCKFLPGDRIRSAAWGEEQYLSAIDTSSVGLGATGNLRVEGLYREIAMPDGLPIVADRVSRIVPLRTINFIPTTQNLVAGDILSYTEITRELKAKYVNPRDDIEIKVLVNLNEAFATIPEEVKTEWMEAGQRILLLDEGVFRGEYEITEVFDRLSFTFNTTQNNNQSSVGAEVDVAASTINWTGHGLSIGDPVKFVSGAASIGNIFEDTIYFVSSEGYTEDSFKVSEIRGATPVAMSGTGDIEVTLEYSGVTLLVGHNMEIDEELSWADSLTSVTSFSTKRRWIPVEAPDNGFSQIPDNHYRHLNYYQYDDQATIRSTMVNDTMYFTNGQDAVQRYDGFNLTRAGLFRWQPHLYLTKDETLDTITVSAPELSSEISTYSTKDSTFEVTKGQHLKFDVGATIRYTRELTDVEESPQRTTDGTITKMWEANNKSFIKVDFNTKIEAFTELVSQSAKIVQIDTKYRYYYRMNLIDANNNRVASAVTGAEDATIALTANCSIRHMLVRPPFLDNFDFTRVEIEIYRTKANQVGPFYKVGAISPEWNRSGGAYVQFVDKINDGNLLDTALDPLTILSGAELGQTWTGPLRAKYITSSANSLVLANFRDWPKLDVAVERYPNESITQATYNNKPFTLRKSNIDTLSETDNYNRMTFQFVGHLPAEGQTRDNRVKSIDWSLLDTNAETNEIVITSTSHGLSVNDWVYLFHYDATETANVSVNPRLGGHYQVSSVIGDNQFAISLSNVNFSDILASSPTYEDADKAKDVNSYIAAATTKNIPVWIGPDSLYGTLVGVDRDGFDINTYAFLRLANAINSAQAACNQEGFRPWVVASAGGEITGTNLILETPYVTDDTLELVVPGFAEQAVYVNGIKRLANDQVQAIARIYPSRLLISFAKYPEIFDLPTSDLDTDSLSAIDVNPADGQQITGVIPFFGDSAFGSAQKDGVLLVFKTASVYVVNINNKRNGQNAVTKIDTRGLGCTAPFSIAPTQNGVMFANQSGIYRITSNFQCEYIGKRLERVWQDKVDASQLDTKMHGHYYPLGNQYKLSVPYEEDGLDYPNRTLVYNTTREYSPDGYRDGSWTTYQNIPAIGWANMLTRAIFATPKGEVYTLRDTGEKTDYRDGDEPISAMAVLRALDFGSASVRKAIGTVNIQFKPDDTSDNNPVVESATDLVNLWEPLDLATVSRRKGIGNVSTRATQQLSVIQFTADRRKGVFFQLRISNDIIDEGLNVAGISLMVKGLATTAVQQARSTRS